MNKTLTILTLSLITASPLTAATIFQATIDTNLNNVDNWTNGLPSVVDEEGTTTADGQLTALLDIDGKENFNINSNISTGANKLRIGSRLLNVGVTTAGSLTISSGGELEVLGGGGNLQIGGNGGSGSVFFSNGSTIDVRKSLIVTNGILSFGSSVSSGSGIQDTFQIGATATLSLDIDGTFANHTIVSSSSSAIFDTGSSLLLNFAAAPTTGDSFTLATDISSYTGAFTNINGAGLGAGQSLELTYGTGTDGLVATVVTIPEPSSLALLGLSGLGLLIRRRR